MLCTLLTTTTHTEEVDGDIVAVAAAAEAEPDAHRPPPLFPPLSLPPP